MRIGVDAMGGDYAPKAAVCGALEASKVIGAEEVIVLFGDKDLVEAEIASYGVEKPANIEIVHCSEVIGMDEHPAQSFTAKTDSSIVVGFSHLKQGLIDGFASAGSTGAMMVGCMFVIKQIDGVIRPAIATFLPTTAGNDIIVLDVGLNIDCKPEVLYQYGIIGSVYAESVLEIENPRVGLLNIGEEDTKGNAQSKAANALMKETSEFNFVGNTEPKTMFLGSDADVFVCDGFVGNLVLKEAEGLYNALSTLGVSNSFMDGINYENVGGTPVLGVNNCVIIGHGCSTPRAITNMILQTRKTIKAELIRKIKVAFTK